jgi:hypothetical protein
MFGSVFELLKSGSIAEYDPVRSWQINRALLFQLLKRA